MARRWPDGRGVGIDFYDEAIADARGEAATCGVADRVAFYQSEISDRPINVPAAILNPVDTITAMYVLHEFAGRGGPDAIRTVLSAICQQFPGRTLILAEGTRADPVRLGSAPPRNSGQLDYSFIHPLSRQGPLRTPEEWQEVIAQSGATLLERIPGFRLVPEWMSLYIIRL